MAIHASDRRIVLGRILRVTSADVEVGVEPADLPELEEVEHFTLTFRAGAGGELAAAVRRTSPTHVHTGSPRLHFRLLHASPAGLAGPRDPSEAGQPDSNRRETFRVQARSLEDVPVTLRPFASSRTSASTERVRSCAGSSTTSGGRGRAGVRSRRRALRRGMRVDVTLELPDRADPLLVTARVRRSQEVRIGMRYSLEFEPTPGRPHDRIERAVLEYVMGCQRLALRRRSS